MIAVRLADATRDAARIAQIYAPHVTTTLVSFEELAPDATEMARRIAATLERWPWLVAEPAGAVVGYAYASSHRERAGYRWSVDVSVYVDDAWHGRGVGRALYGELLAILRRQGVVNVYAGIALPNAASVALHESIGMRRIGVYEAVGWKLGRWVDVAWYGLRLAEPDEPPAEPIPLPALTGG
ncbi:MAG TPA: arsinothricin resistance N-acetyltransferase ArsN1 family B [Candidatus Limnocylindrales bacterium]